MIGNQQEEAEREDANQGEFAELHRGFNFSVLSSPLNNNPDISVTYNSFSNSSIGSSFEFIENLTPSTPGKQICHGVVLGHVMKLVAAGL
jgi:hypothetical protein